MFFVWKTKIKRAARKKEEAEVQFWEGATVLHHFLNKAFKMKIYPVSPKTFFVKFFSAQLSFDPKK